MDKQRYLTFHFGAILYLKCYKSVYVCWSVHPSNKKIQVMYQIVRKLGLMMCLHVCLAEKHNSESKRLKKKIKIKPQHISSYVLMKTHTHTKDNSLQCCCCILAPRFSNLIYALYCQKYPLTCLGSHMNLSDKPILNP